MNLPIGYFMIFIIILSPVYVMILASLLGKPRDFRVAGLALGVFGGLIFAAFVMIYFAGVALSWIMP